MLPAYVVTLDTKTMGYCQVVTMWHIDITTLWQWLIVGNVTMWLWDFAKLWQCDPSTLLHCNMKGVKILEWDGEMEDGKMIR